MNRVLVSAASRHGSTAEIGEFIAKVLGEAGYATEVENPSPDLDLQPYDAFVLGSGVYAGHWLREARELIGDNQDLLASRPVWLFSSGPLGEPPKPEDDPVDVADLMEATDAEGHVVFAGKLDKSRLSFGERAIASALRAPAGDFRDWDVIRSWVAGITATLRQLQQPVS